MIVTEGGSVKLTVVVSVSVVEKSDVVCLKLALRFINGVRIQLAVTVSVIVVEKSEVI